MVRAVAFMGCGWRFPFMFGVAKFIEESRVRDDTVIVAGVSGGAGVALSLCTSTVTEMYERGLAKRARCPVPPFGTCGLMCEVVREMDLPPVCKSGKMQLVVGRSRYVAPLRLVPDFRSSWTDADDLLDSLRGSCQIPFLDGAVFHSSPGGLFLDGEFAVPGRTMRAHLVSRLASHLANLVHEGTPGVEGTVIIVDFDEAADIRPSVKFPRLWSFVYPDEASMRAMYADGYRQAERYFSAPCSRPEE